MKNAESNETEIRLLSGFPFSKTRVAGGNLSRFEQRSLEDLRFLMETIESKYPGEAFEWFSFHPQFGIQSSAELVFGTAGHEGRYTARIETVKLADGTTVRQVADNYYGALISADLSEAVRKVTGAESAEARVTALRGMEFDGTVTADSLMACGRLPESVIVLTVSPGQMHGELLEEWKERLTASGIPGFYQVYLNCKTMSPDRMYCGSFRVSARGNRRA